MKITPYGIFVGLAWLFFNSSIQNLDWKFIALVFITILVQSQLCSTCHNQYTMASVLATFPLVLLFLYDCFSIKNILISFAIASAIGRIGCLYAGCCSGKPCNKSIWSLHYDKGYIVNNYLHKNNVDVYPSILLEIILQFIIGYLVYKSDYGIQLYGILNLLLIWLTNKWRLQVRMNSTSYIPIIGLIIFTILSYFKCPSKIPFSFKFSFKPYMYILSAFWTFIVSNNINIGTFIK